MNLTVLLDLDDTLLANDIDKFLPVYLKALTQNLNTLPPKQVVQHLMAATQQMSVKRQAAQTLEQVFDSSFYPALGVSKQDLWETIDQFYTEVFPTLQPVTQPRDGAVKLVDALFEQGDTIAIATNPLFPRAATYHRLTWAGLPVERYPFGLVSTYEDFHFSKPDPAYYAEVLGQLGWPEQPAVMVGDDLELDILPAARLGLPTYWINLSGKPMPASLHPLSSSGNLEGVRGWIEKIRAAQLEVDYNYPEALEAILRSTPAVMETIAKNLAQDLWNRRPEAGEWSFTEILYHLRDVDAEVNWPRIEKVCNQENPFLPGVSTDPWAEERQYILRNGSEGLGGFLEIRTRILTLLQALDADGWQRTARHAIFGPTSLQELTGFIATHDKVHIRQAKQTAENVKTE